MKVNNSVIKALVESGDLVLKWISIKEMVVELLSEPVVSLLILIL